MRSQLKKKKKKGVGLDQDDFATANRYRNLHSTQQMRTATGIFGNMNEFLNSGTYGDVSAQAKEEQAEMMEDEDLDDLATDAKVFFHYFVFIYSLICLLFFKKKVSEWE